MCALSICTIRAAGSWRSDGSPWVSMATLLYGTEWAEIRPTNRKEIACSVLDGLHCLAYLVVTDRQIGHLQSTPARLLLGNWKAPSGADDLAHTRVTEQVRVHW